MGRVSTGTSSANSHDTVALRRAAQKQKPSTTGDPRAIPEPGPNLAKLCLGPMFRCGYVQGGIHGTLNHSMSNVEKLKFVTGVMELWVANLQSGAEKP